MKLKQIVVALASAGSILIAAPGVAQAGELEEMKAMLQKLQSRIDQLESQQAAAAAAPKAAVPSVLPGNPSFLANSSVTLYGKIDMFTEYDTRGSQGTRLALESGGMNGSRWGVKGGADITKDLRGIYQLEGGVYVNKGSSAQGGLLFGRQAYAGVESKFGTFTAGRQYSPFYNTVLSFDPFEQGYGSPTNSGQVTAGTTRYDSSLVYQSPVLNGFKASAMAALGGQTGNSRHDATALSVSYSAGPLGLGAAVQRDDHVGSSNTSKHMRFLGASYQLSSTKLMAGIGRVNTDPDTGSSTHRNEWMVGSKTAVTPTGQLLLIYGRGKTDQLSDKSSAVTAGWIEALSQQVNVYGVISNHTNDPASALVPMGTNSSGSYSINKGDSALGMALGFQYSF
ncbi:MAG: porin [Actinomycetota bacterium]